MAKYALSQMALADLSNIWEYTYEEWSQMQADKYYTLLINTCQKLADKPSIGKAYKQIADDIFGYRIKKHIIFYHTISKKSTTTVEIIRILHESMDLRNQLAEG